MASSRLGGDFEAFGWPANAANEPEDWGLYIVMASCRARCCRWRALVTPAALDEPWAFSKLEIAARTAYARTHRGGGGAKS